MESIKRKLIKVLATAYDTDMLRWNKVVLVTPFGVISGKPEPAGEEYEDLSTTAVISELCDKVVDDYGAENVDGNDGFIFMTDVTIHSSNKATFNVANLVVFYDQIIGITLGNVEDAMDEERKYPMI